MPADSSKAASSTVGAPGGAAGRYFSRTFAALGYRGYMWLWLAVAGYSISESIEWMGRNWLLWQMTSSPFLLGLMNLARAVPRLVFGLVGGVLADRLDKRRLLLYSQATMMMLKFLMAALILSGWIEVWHVFALAVGLGLTMAVLAPTRESITPSLVPKDQLLSAVTLNRIASFVLFLLTPAAAGPASEVIGIGGIYLVSALINVVVVYFTWKLPKVASARVGTASWWGDMVGGIRYVVSHGTVLRLVILSLVPMVFAMPYQTMLPVFADRVLHVGVSGYGLLMGAVGIGSVGGMLLLVPLGNLRQQGKVVVGCIVALGLLLVVFAASPWVAASLALMVGVGAASFVYRTMTVTLMYSLSPPEMYGRVMSILLLDFALMSFGSTLAGALADSYGAPMAVASMAVITVVLGLGVGLGSAQIRKLRSEAKPRPAAG